jgi:hypothetical protein
MQATAMPVLPRFQRISEILQTADIPMIIWGDSAMAHHGIPTMIVVRFPLTPWQRDYILIPDQMLDTATSLLFKTGLQNSIRHHSLALGNEGMKALADTCSRLEYPDSYGVGSQELLVIPTSFVGSRLSLDSLRPRD